MASTRATKTIVIQVVWVPIVCRPSTAPRKPLSDPRRPRTRYESLRFRLLLQHRLEWLGLLEITAKCIGEHHLPGILALRFEQGWASYKHRDTTCAGDGHIQPIGTIEKLHATR